VKKILWLVVGAGLGFVAAQQLAKSPQGRQFFDDVNGKAREFGSAVLDGYKQREAELRAAVGDPGAALDDLRYR
jgi:hypothetical protein